MTKAYDNAFAIWMEYHRKTFSRLERFLLKSDNESNWVRSLGRWNFSIDELYKATKHIEKEHGQDLYAKQHLPTLIEVIQKTRGDAIQRRKIEQREEIQRWHAEANESREENVKLWKKHRRRIQKMSDAEIYEILGPVFALRWLTGQCQIARNQLIEFCEKEDGK